METADHQSLAICHYTIFPTSVFNNNPEHIQLFRSVPLAVDRTRFEVWELWYKDGDDAYLARVHWDVIVWTLCPSAGAKYTQSFA